uniref:G-patch domain-containing protein n=1 Tax=Macrostomum lignano TaxID=282301 RepID=A0A1I8FNW9_9PLAT
MQKMGWRDGQGLGKRNEGPHRAAWPLTTRLTGRAWPPSMTGRLLQSTEPAAAGRRNLQRCARLRRCCKCGSLDRGRCGPLPPSPGPRWSIWTQAPHQRPAGGRPPATTSGAAVPVGAPQRPRALALLRRVLRASAARSTSPPGPAETRRTRKPARPPSPCSSLALCQSLII